MNDHRTLLLNEKTQEGKRKTSPNFASSRLCVFFIFLILSAANLPVFSQALSPKDHAAIMEVLSQQQDCWNKGDIDCFMEGYWKSDSLAFMGSSGPNYGWQTTLDNYKKRYANREAMGELTFTILTLRKLDKKAAFVIGKWHLKRTIGDIGGYFSLVWRKIEGKWVIVSDHTS